MGLGKLWRKARLFGPGVLLARGADRFAGQPVTGASPIIVGGCGRSGTTLLRVMLDSHRNICCGPESQLLLARPVRLDVLAERFDVAPRTLAGLYKRARSRAGFVDAFFREYCRTRQKRRWAEKSPGNLMNLDYIFAAFPEARFIHMIRDGRDVACSWRTHPRHKVVNGQLVPTNIRRPIAECIDRWVEAMAAARPWRADKRYMEVHYEQLVRAPAETLREIMAFVNEPWDEAMLDYHEVASGSRDVTRFPQNPEATRAIETKSLSRWQQDLSDDEKAIVKGRAGQLLIEMGYESSPDW